MQSSCRIPDILPDHFLYLGLQERLHLVLCGRKAAIPTSLNGETTCFYVGHCFTPSQTLGSHLGQDCELGLASMAGVSGRILCFVLLGDSPILSSPIASTQGFSQWEWEGALDHPACPLPFSPPLPPLPISAALSSGCGRHKATGHRLAHGTQPGWAMGEGACYETPLPHSKICTGILGC